MAEGMAGAEGRGKTSAASVGTSMIEGARIIDAEAWVRGVPVGWIRIGISRIIGRGSIAGTGDICGRSCFHGIGLCVGGNRLRGGGLGCVRLHGNGLFPELGSVLNHGRNE